MSSLLLLAAPSVPRATETPRSGVLSGKEPLPSFRLLFGLWTTSRTSKRRRRFGRKPDAMGENQSGGSRSPDFPRYSVGVILSRFSDSPAPTSFRESACAHECRALSQSRRRPHKPNATVVRSVGAKWTVTRPFLRATDRRATGFCESLPVVLHQSAQGRSAFRPPATHGHFGHFEVHVAKQPTPQETISIMAAIVPSRCLRVRCASSGHDPFLHPLHQRFLFRAPAEASSRRGVV
jgi:hypothetical protein